MRALFKPQAEVVPPRRVTDVLLPEHVSCPLDSLRHPAALDFSHANFKLRGLDALAAVREGALAELNVACNDLTSLAALNRFQQLRKIIATGNRLQIGSGLVLRLPRLQEIDLSHNSLTAVPPLDVLPQLQVLRLAGNKISSNWTELRCCPTLREIDISRNRLQWPPGSDEFNEALQVLPSLRRLRELKFAHNPVSETPGMRYLLISHAPRLERLDSLQASAAPPPTSRPPAAPRHQSAGHTRHRHASPAGDRP